MPVVTVQMWEGRSDQQKRELVKAITEVMVEKTGTKTEGVQVVIYDIPKSNWGIAGKLSSDE